MGKEKLKKEFKQFLKQNKMVRTFDEFEGVVASFSNPDDFRQNRHKLREVNISDYDNFIKLLQLGCEIPITAIVCDKLSRISAATGISESMLIRLSTEFRIINMLIDVGRE